MSLKKVVLQKTSQVILPILNLLDRLALGEGVLPGKYDTQKDPYSWYKILRSRAPVVRSYANRGWLVVGFDAVQAIFRDPRFSSDMRKNDFIVGVLRTAADGQEVPFLDNPSMLNLDPPDHTRLRKLVSFGFLKKYIDSLEPNIVRIVDTCLDDINPAADQFDLMASLAKPLPAIVIAEMLGLPEEDREQFQIWSNELVGISRMDDPTLVELGNKANNQLIDYFAKVIDVKRETRGQDLICQLIAAEEEGDRLTPKEMYSTCVLLLAAGHETTTRLISNGVYTLLKHPDQFAMLKNDPSLIPNAIEEMLRFEPPVQVMPRFAKEDCEFFGKEIKKDQLLLVGIGSANRDESANHNAEEFDVNRKNIAHVSFGYGIHLCLGLALARLEARVALAALLDRFPEMSLTDQEPDWGKNNLVRGMEHLYINTNTQEVPNNITGVDGVQP